ncbi:hypothetical protein CGCTS75_v008594 [Colletotrichum tropicale]|uniref:uncharacterized protein n=1 Tax=Colletotrichum aenigma TaxID=1215731 RepID=UPI0018727D51|nr:uncharacterized protein CGCA056_v009201 [Colletotrichum aenigma]KAF4826946.1 hypothetical protein CGCTS75_v008594 [Colletotrichum tropicale]KAF5519034.1 hypothetical protein CGCA056_v009201 [Colletotrichum aenigma]
MLSECLLLAPAWNVRSSLPPGRSIKHSSEPDAARTRLRDSTIFPDAIPSTAGARHLLQSQKAFLYPN